MRKGSAAESQEEGLSLGFKNVGFVVDTRETFLGKLERKQILVNSSGIVHPGQCCAILGSSGTAFLLLFPCFLPLFLVLSCFFSLVLYLFA